MELWAQVPGAEHILSKHYSPHSFFSYLSAGNTPGVGGEGRTWSGGWKEVMFQR